MEMDANLRNKELVLTSYQALLTTIELEFEFQSKRRSAGDSPDDESQMFSPIEESALFPHPLPITVSTILESALAQFGKQLRKRYPLVFGKRWMQVSMVQLHPFTQKDENLSCS